MLRSITIAALCVDIEHIGRIYLSNPDTVIHNYGMAFSLLSDYPAITAWLSGVAFAVILAVFFLADLNNGEKLGYSLMLGGALSNFAEKVILGYVIDWIPIPFIPLTVNLADIQVSIGALIVLMNLEI